MRRLPKTAITLVAVIACGCASTSVRYLTLNMDPSGTMPDSGSVVVEDIELSDSLRRPELLVQAQQNEIEYYGDAHWVSSLTELVMEKLEAEFGVAADASQPARLSAKIWKFGEDETAETRCGRVKLSASVWPAGSSLRDDPGWTKIYEECVPIEGADVSNVAEALSKGLEVIALQIANDVAQRN